MPVLVLTEHAKDHPTTARLISAALGFGTQIDILAIDTGNHTTAEAVAETIVKLATNYKAVLADSTGAGRDFIPRAAAMLDIQPISDVIDIINADTFVRPIYAGNAFATVHTSQPKKMMTVRAAAFAPVSDEEITVKQWDYSDVSSISRFISFEKTQSERPELTTARRVVVGGYGIGSAEKFAEVIALADKIGAAVGTTRNAADAGFAPNELQVGQSGKTIAPELYIGLGVSGAAQHVCGIRGSKVIVAVNNDPNAPIFKTADYGLVGDVTAVIRELKEKL